MMVLIAAMLSDTKDFELRRPAFVLCYVCVCVLCSVLCVRYVCWWCCCYCCTLIIIWVYWWCWWVVVVVGCWCCCVNKIQSIFLKYQSLLKIIIIITIQTHETMKNKPLDVYKKEIPPLGPNAIDPKLTQTSYLLDTNA